MRRTLNIAITLTLGLCAQGAQANVNSAYRAGDETVQAAPARKPTGGGDLKSSCHLFSADHPYNCKGLAQMDLIRACSQFPKGHPYSCEALTAMEDILRACNQFPKGHPQSCENLAAMDMIKACNQFPTDHPYGCGRLLSMIPKCPPGELPPLGCKQLLVEDERRHNSLRDEDGKLPSIASFGAVTAFNGF